MNITKKTTNQNEGPIVPPRQFQFSLRTLFTISTFCCIFAASLVWVFRTEHLGKLFDMPIWLPDWVVVFPGGPWFLFIGIVVMPVLSFGMAVVSVVLVARTSNRPFSFLLFFGYVGVVLFTWFAPSYEDDCSVRIIVALALSACLTLGEVLVRRLPRNHLTASLLAMGTAFGYYFFLVAAIICASV